MALRQPMQYWEILRTAVYEMIPALAGMQLLGSIEELTSTRIDLVKVLQDGKITRSELHVVDDILDKCHGFTRAAIALEMEKKNRRSCTPTTLRTY